MTENEALHPSSAPAIVTTDEFKSLQVDADSLSEDSDSYCKQCDKDEHDEPLGVESL